MIENERYNRLIGQEAEHWGKVQFDPNNPQLWHDPRLFEIFFGKEYRRFVQRATSCGPSVLELGCGEGNLSLELARQNVQVNAIDLSPERIAKAKEKAEKLSLTERTRFLVGDLNTITLMPERFDCVVAHDALHHILKIDRLCEEVQKTLKPGGSFFVMDYIGMGFVRKTIAAALYAALPTYQPYGGKWNLRRRLPAFFASEKKKRQAIKQGGAALHHDSPFEEISQASIIEAIAKRFEIAEHISFNPFFFYLAPKIRFPKDVKYFAAKLFRTLDDMLINLRLTHGAYFFIEARKR